MHDFHINIYTAVLVLDIYKCMTFSTGLVYALSRILTVTISQQMERQRLLHVMHCTSCGTCLCHTQFQRVCVSTWARVSMQDMLSI